MSDNIATNFAENQNYSIQIPVFTGMIILTETLRPKSKNSLRLKQKTYFDKLALKLLIAANCSSVIAGPS